MVKKTLVEAESESESEPELVEQEEESAEESADSVGIEDEIEEIMPVSRDFKIMLRRTTFQTSHSLSKAEYHNIIATRGQQIAISNDALVNISDLNDPMEMAKRELLQKKCPLFVRREIGSPKMIDGELCQEVEIRNPNEMALPV